MPVNTITTSDGRVFKLGRTRPVARSPRLAVRNYMLRSLPAPPNTIDYQAAAWRSLMQMYLNDRLGCCVISAMAHLVGVFTGNAGGRQFLFTPEQIIQLYGAIGGYDPKQNRPNGFNPTDNGCDEETALNYWRLHGAPAGQYPITGAIRVNAADPIEYRTALWLFENLFFGVDLPDEWISPFPRANNFTWGVAGRPDPRNGHAFCGCGYGSRGVVIGTWGMAGTITDDAIAEYANPAHDGALYAVLSQATINRAKQKAPNGFDWTQLMADFQAIGSSV